MPPDRRLLREIYSAYEGMKQAQLLQGQWVHWFRFNLAATTSHPVYDVGPQRAWYNPITVPVYYGGYQRAPQNYDDDGLYLVDRVNLVISYDAFFHSTMPDPDPTGQDHVNDRVGFDGHLFSVDGFFPRGRTASHFLTISVSLLEVAAEELFEDQTIPMFAPYLTAS